jgi:hypothetical protein
MKTVQLKLTGTRPLLCHNVQLADPDNPITVQIAEITKKRKKTPQDRREIAKLEWHGGLYIADGQPVFPVANILKALANAAKVTRQGAAVQRAVAAAEFEVPINYGKSRTLDQLHDDPNYHDRRAVGVSSSKVIRTRPRFPKWGMECTLYLLPEVLDLRDLKSIATLAGTIEGVGDGRKIGMGRFECEIVDVS